MKIIVFTIFLVPYRNVCTCFEKEEINTYLNLNNKCLSVSFYKKKCDNNICISNNNIADNIEDFEIDDYLW